jgi:hypothetical protein
MKYSIFFGKQANSMSLMRLLRLFTDFCKVFSQEKKKFTYVTVEPKSTKK